MADHNDNHVCPWWHAYFFDNPFRRIVHRPGKMLGRWVLPGMHVADIGCGMGYFSIAMAKMTGPEGKVTACDIQEKMLSVMLRRAEKAGVKNRIFPHLVTDHSRMNLPRQVDFVLAFWMVHETPDASAFFREMAETMKPGGKLFAAEPWMHVGKKEFEKMVETARENGFTLLETPGVFLSRAAVFARTG